ncbi:MAG TPA: LysR family transcriptional regulator, partial [Burkholderiaceae bacterium]|nr:LysR family transcriptional regulator [Burkholderiaceae bacterium]
MPTELRQLRHVIALADHGNFARAAEALRMSQPALSRSV